MRYFLILFLFVVSCSEVNGDNLPDNVVIFPANSHKNAFESELGRWTPTKSDVVKAEKFVNEYLLSEEGKKQFSDAHTYFTETEEWNKKIFSNFFDRFSSDKRQYSGIIKEGKKILRVNGLCSVKGEKWKEQLIVVKGGGHCYYWYEFDLENKKIFELYFNALI